LRDEKLNLIARFNEVLHCEGPAAAIRAYGAENFVWWALGHGEIQSEVDGILAVMRANIDSDGMTMRVIGSTIEGERMALEIQGRATLKDGTIYENQFHILYVVRDGRIVSLREYYDTARAVEIWSPIFAGSAG